MGILDKSTIEKWITPYLTRGSRGFEPKVELADIVLAILYRLKTGCQWRELPVDIFFKDKTLSWNSVFHHFNKWSKAGCWQIIWQNFLKENHAYLDLSSIQLDGSHTPAKNGGDAVGYQGRKSCKTTNTLFICDNQGVMLALSEPQEGQHHDLFQIKTLFEEMCAILKGANIDIAGLFLNADPGFDSDDFKSACEAIDVIPNIKPNKRNSSSKDGEPYEDGTHIFDEKLYRDRSVIEHANAWIDGFKALLVRFEFSVRNWRALHFIAFIAILMRKIQKNKKV
jgi:transposase